jgi:hypothetical protein
MTQPNETDLRGLIDRAKELEDSACPACDGDGLVVIEWDDNVYENIEGRCPRCNGTGYLKKYNEGLIPDLANALDALLADRAELAATVDHLQNWCGSPEDEAAVRAGALEEAALVSCYWCRENRKSGKNYQGEYAHVDVNGLLTVTCYASEIRKLLAADQGQGEKEGVGE